MTSNYFGGSNAAEIRQLRGLESRKRSKAKDTQGKKKKVALTAHGGGTWDEAKLPPKWRFHFESNEAFLKVSMMMQMRFPDMLQAVALVVNAGVIAVIPHIVFYIFGAFPIFFMQTILGQYTCLGTLEIWRMYPSTSGIGYTMCLLTMLRLLMNFPMIARMELYVVAAFSGAKWCYCDLQKPSSYSQCVMPKDANITCGPGRETSAAFYAREQFGLRGGGRLVLRNDQWQLLILLAITWLIAYLIWRMPFERVLKGLGWVFFICILSMLPAIMTWFAYQTHQGFQVLAPNSERLSTSRMWLEGMWTGLNALLAAPGTVIQLSSHAPPDLHPGITMFFVVLANCMYIFVFTLLIANLVGSQSLNYGLENIRAHPCLLELEAYGTFLPIFSDYVCDTGAPPYPALVGFFFFFVFSAYQFYGQILEGFMLAQAIFEKWTMKPKHMEIFKGVLCAILFVGGCFICTDKGNDIYTLLKTLEHEVSVALLIIVVLVLSAVYGLQRILDDFEFLSGRELSPKWKAVMVTAPFATMVSGWSMVKLLHGHFEPPMSIYNIVLFCLFLSPLIIEASRVLVLHFHNQTVRDLCRRWGKWGPRRSDMLRRERNMWKPVAGPMGRRRVMLGPCPHTGCLVNSHILAMEQKRFMQLRKEFFIFAERRLREQRERREVIEAVLRSTSVGQGVGIDAEEPVFVMEERARFISQQQ